MYKIIRNFLFLFPAESIHYFSMNVLKTLIGIPVIIELITRSFSSIHKKLVNVFDIQLINRVGLGAGFDKNALYLDELETLGLGFVDIGTVTPKPQPGNEKPRLF